MTEEEEFITGQECIPVGCVLAACRPYAGVCFPGGGLPGPRGGLPCPRWVCQVPGGVSDPGGWCLTRGGLPGLGGCLIQGGLIQGVLPGPRGEGVSQHALRQNPPPPVNRMTNRCKNITLATTSLRPVINQAKYFMIYSVTVMKGLSRKFYVLTDVVHKRFRITPCRVSCIVPTPLNSQRLTTKAKL